MHATSKAFRARLELGEEYVSRIQSWTAEHFALSAIFGCGKALVLVALTDRPRSAASFARTLRGALTQLSIPTSARILRGHWVNLISDREALLICSGSGDLPSGPSPPPAAPPPHEGDVRTIALR